MSSKILKQKRVTTHVPKDTPNNSKNPGVRKLKHYFEYTQFIVWIATPKDARSPKTQSELSKNFGVGEDTLSEWKTRIGFWEAVSLKRKEWGRERTPDVINALYNRIMRTGGASEVKLWLQLIEEWSERISLDADGSLLSEKNKKLDEIAGYLKKSFEGIRAKNNLT